MGIVITGGGGMLGRAVRSALDERGITDYHDAQGVDITHMTMFAKRSLVINCAGITKGRTDVSEARIVAVNAMGPHLLAEQAHRLIHISTDCVFSGRPHVLPHEEWSDPDPNDLYGRSKLTGEPSMLPDSRHVVLRGSFIGFGPRGLLAWMTDQPEGATIDGYVSWAWSGLYVGAFARIVVEIALTPSITGLLHVPGPILTKLDLVQRVAGRIRPDLTVIPKNPPGRDMALGSSRPEWDGIHIPDWEEMLEELDADYRHCAGGPAPRK